MSSIEVPNLRKDHRRIGLVSVARSFIRRCFTRLSDWLQSWRNHVAKRNEGLEGMASSAADPHVWQHVSAPLKRGQRAEEHLDLAEPVSRARKILIFDQDSADLVRNTEPFEAHGFEVYKCASIESAMRCIEREELDFALVDQVSPAFEGLRVIRHLVRYNLHTPFIVLTQSKDMACHQQARALGAVDYLQKPVSNVEMNWLIEHYFGILANS